MGKPWGMTAVFHIVRPTAMEDRIYETVEAAISAGVSVTDFLAEVRDCWEIALHEKAAGDARELARLQL